MATDEDDLDLQDVPEDYVAEDERNGESGNRVRSPLEMADPHEPEREPILIDTTGLAPENYYLLQSLVRVCNEKLWHYKTFPIVLPEPVALVGDQENPQTSKSRIHVDDLFVKPNFNEMREVSLDGHGVPKRLTFEQLDAVRSRGEFEVDSVRFPGQKHKWLISQLLLKGKEKIKNTQRDDLANALYFVVCLSRDCIVSEAFSLFASLNGWSQGLMNLLDVFFGVPLVVKGRQAREKLEEERAKYHVAELICSSKRAKDELVAYLIQLLRSNSTEWIDEASPPPPAIPYHFRTPAGLEIDLRLLGNDLMSTAKPDLLHILSSSLSGWFVKRKHIILAELEKEGVGGDDVEAIASERLADEYLERVVERVRKDPKIESLGSGVAELLVRQVKTSEIVNKVHADAENQFSKLEKEVRSELEEQHPVLSRVKAWKERQVMKRLTDSAMDRKWETHEAVISQCREQGLQQSAYFFERDLSFRQKLEPILAKELSEVKEPYREFSFSTQIWIPKNWKISERQDDGSYMEIPTVIQDSDQDQYEIVNRKESPSYKLEKERTVGNSTKYPFWRWTNFFLRTASWMWNIIFFLGVLVPFRSPVSFCALFSVKPYYPKLVLSQKSGCLRRDKSYKVETIASRLGSLWSHISESRKSFESTPDTGLLPKSATRALNRFYNYVVKGLCGTILIGAAFPVGMVAASTTSLVLALTAPVWVVGVSLAGHLAAVFIADIDGPSCTGAILWNLLINILSRGVLQPIVAVTVAFLIAPLLACFTLAFAYLRRGLRESWDWVMFHVLIKRRARIPERNTFFAKRIAGPGLASEYYYQILPEQALAALDACMEKDELEAYHAQTAKKIGLPLNQYNSFVKPLLAPFGVVPSGSVSGPCKQLESEQQALEEALSKAVWKREEALMGSRYGDSSKDTLSRVRLNDADLKKVLAQGVLMARDFYTTRVFTRMTDKKERKRFWEERGLLDSDYLGLVSEHLSFFFSPAFLTPLQESDTTFNLQVKHWSLSRYVNMANSGKWKEDLDVARAINPQKSTRSIKQPKISIDAFNPVSHASEDGSTLLRLLYPLVHVMSGDHSRTLCGVLHSRRWLVYAPNRGRLRPGDLPLRLLHHPLPVPHPVEIVLVIYRRERNEDDEADDANEALDFDRKSFRNKMRKISDYPQRALDVLSDSVLMASVLDGSPSSSAASSIKDDDEKGVRDDWSEEDGDEQGRQTPGTIV